jgi:hypothetical protein
MFPLFLHFLSPPGVSVGDRVRPHDIEGHVESLSFGLMGVRFQFPDEPSARRWFNDVYMKGVEVEPGNRDWKIVVARGKEGVYLNE